MYTFTDTSGNKFISIYLGHLIKAIIPMLICSNVLVFCKDILLMHDCVKLPEVHCPYSYPVQVCEAFVGKDLYERVKDVLMPQGRVGKEFRELSTLAWKFATISPPLIVRQPKKFNETLIDREANHWNEDLPEFSLVYTRPVVYRSYHGMLGAQGYAGNAPIEKGTKTDKVINVLKTVVGLRL